MPSWSPAQTHHAARRLVTLVPRWRTPKLPARRTGEVIPSSSAGADADAWIDVGPATAPRPAVRSWRGARRRAGRPRPRSVGPRRNLGVARELHVAQPRQRRVPARALHLDLAL